MPYTKEQRSEYNKEYREKNKERLKENKKKYREENKEKIKEYREENKEKLKEYKKEYRENNKEKIAEYDKEYRQTETGKKRYRINNWKKYGIISDDWDALYDRYITTLNCEDCNCELVEGIYGANKRCLDHDHTTGLVRGIVCNTCNLKRK